MTDYKGVNIRSKRLLQTLLLVFLMSQWCSILINKSNLLSKRNNEINIQKRNIGNKNIVVNTQNLKRSKQTNKQTNNECNHC